MHEWTVNTVDGRGPGVLGYIQRMLTGEEKAVKRVATMAAAAVLCAALLVFFGGALLRYAHPMRDASYDFSLAWSGEAMPENWVYDQKGWSVFTMENGERRELAPDGNGGFSGAVQPGETFYYTRALTEAVDAPTLQIDAYDRAIAVYLDGECLYSDGAMDAAIGEVELAELGWTRSAPVLVFLPADYQGRELTIAQSAGAAEMEPLTVYPCAVRLTCGYAYESGLIAESFAAAIPATLLLAAGAFLLAAFAVGAQRGRWNGPFLCAALFVLLWMAGTLANAGFFNVYHPSTRGNTAYLSRCFAVSALLMYLASRAKRLRALPWTLAILNAACSVLTLGIDLTHEVYSDSLSAFLRDVPFQVTAFAGLLAAVVCAWLLWRREGRFYRLFAPLSAACVGAVLFYGAVSHGDKVLEQLKYAFAAQSFTYFLWPLTAAVMAAATAAVIAEIVSREIARRVEAHRMSERAEMAAASYESLRAQHEQVMMLRHDMNRHLQTLRQMSGEAPVQAYLDDLIGQNENIPAILQSGNRMIDIILNGRLAAAKAAGVDVEIQNAQAPDTLPMRDADLCSLMLNIIDNAVAAASDPGLERPRIILDLRMKGNYFVFSCENTRAPGTAGKKDGHGLGLKIVENIVERYDCLMEVERAERSYQVTVAMPVE